tara:strand:+ start:116 stop:727 length:612 start_codon:yes stop_codon:yes gene_type:complete
VKDFGLVVIGAHFGVWLTDIISKYKNTNILLVEPVPYNYKILSNKFKDYKNIFICTKAVYSKNQKKTFYFVKEASIPKLGKHWASGIGSFDKQHIINHKSKRFNIQDIDIDSIEIDFITFDNLIKEYEIKKIDSLQVDVEGAEYEILNTINFKNIQINSIQFESKHFDGTFTVGPKLNLIKDKLTKFGYKLIQLDEENILAKK